MIYSEKNIGMVLVNNKEYRKAYFGSQLIYQSIIFVSVPTLSGSYTYNGSEQSVSISSYDPSIIEVSGNTATNAGTHTVTFHLKDTSKYAWLDESTSDKTASWSIARASVGAKPGSSISKDYTGSVQNNGYTTPSGVAVSGSTSGTNGGSYTAYYTPDGNHKWSDDTTVQVSRTLTINYVWNKYNAVYSYTQTSTTKAAKVPFWNESDLSRRWYSYAAAKNWSFSSSTGIYTLSNGASVLIKSPETLIASGYSGQPYCGRPTTTNPAPTTSAEIAILESNKGSVSGVPGYCYAGGLGCTVKGSSGSYSRGSTSYGAVRSTSSSTYPANARHSDGYWYVKAW